VTGLPTWNLESHASLKAARFARTEDETPLDNFVKEVAMKRILRIPTLALLVVPIVALSVPALAQDCPVPGPFEPCTGCHVPGLNPNVQLAYDTWVDSEHLNGVTFGPDRCKNCHQPFRADEPCGEPDREYGIECATCHTDHTDDCDRELRVWDRTVCDYGPRIEHDNLNELCLTCHDRPDLQGHSAFDAPPQGWAKVMIEQKDVQCVDCHMPIVPFTDTYGNETEGRTHDWNVAANLPYSCGTMPGGCHFNKDDEWALKQIEKKKIHGGERGSRVLLEGRRQPAHLRNHGQRESLE
jgi:hypothetical protein